MVEGDELFLVNVSAFLDELDESSAATEETKTSAGTGNEDLTDKLFLAESSVDDHNAADEGPQRVTTKKNTEDNRSLDQRQKLRNQLARKRRARYRQKLSREKESLVKQEVELSAQLRRLQTKVGTITHETMQLSAWRAIAKRQFEMWTEAEHQQKQLRAAVASRAKLIQQMKALVERPLGKLSVSLAPCSMEWSWSKFEGAALLDTLLAQLDPSYSQMNRFYSDLDFKMSTAIEFNPERKVDGAFAYFESSSAAVIPFTCDKAADAMASILLSDFGGIRYEAVSNPENTVAVRYNINYRCQSGELVPFWAHSAIRRYEENDRVVFVWRLVMEGQGQFAGLYSDETNWVVIRPSHTASFDSENSPCTVGEIYTRMVPSCVRNDQDDEFTKTVLKSGEQEVKEMTRMLDSLLLKREGAR